MTSQRMVSSAVGAIVAICGAGSLQAQQTDVSASGELTEVVVTAQRREENIQRAALAITAVSGDAIAQGGVTDVQQLSQLTAGLQVTPSGGPYTTFTVRSVSSLAGNAFSDPAVALNINGVYLATPTVVHGLFYDLDRVEVLKGPQGTLYGRNATAGAVNVISRRPQADFHASLGVDIGDYSRRNVNAMVNVPVTDTVAFRVAGQSINRDGYYSDGTSDDDAQAARGSLLLTPTDALSVLLTADYAHLGGHGPGASVRKACATGTCFVGDPWAGIGNSPTLYTSVGLPPQTKNTYDDSDFYGVAGNLDWDTDLGTVTVIGGYRKSKVRYVTTTTSWQLRERQDPSQYSLETRLASKSGSPLQYVVGAFYLNTQMHALANGENATRRNFSDQHTNLDGWVGAAFSQLTYSLTDTFRATGGLRYTHEEKSSNSMRYTVNTVGPDPVIPNPPVGTPANIVIGSQSWDKVNWKAGVEFDAAPRSLLYANVSTGFKAGGFFYGPPGANTYQPERVLSYVLGSKNRFLDNRLQLNAEAFYLDYKDQQVSFVKLIGVASTFVTENAGASHAQGIEVEAEFLATDSTRLGLQGQYLDSKYDRFSYVTPAPLPSTTACVQAPSAGQFVIDCSGRRTPRSGEWTALANVEQTIHLSNGARLVGEADARYESGFEGDVNYIPQTRTYPTTRYDLSLSYLAANDRLAVKAYVDNVSDEKTISTITLSNAYAVNGIVAAPLQPPRTYGVRATVNW